MRARRVAILGFERRRSVTVTRGAELLGAFQNTERSIRKWWKACGGHLFRSILALG